MPDWAERIVEELSRYDRRSMVGDTVIDQLLYIGSKLRMVRSGWECWKDLVLDDLDRQGVDGEGIYELIAEDYLGDREIQFMWVLDHRPDTFVKVNESGTTVTLSRDGEKVCSVWLHDGIVTYTDYVADVTESHCPKDYIAPICDIPSFE